MSREQYQGAEVETSPEEESEKAGTWNDLLWLVRRNAEKPGLHGTYPAEAIMQAIEEYRKGGDLRRITRLNGYREAAERIRRAELNAKTDRPSEEER